MPAALCVLLGVNALIQRALIWAGIAFVSAALMRPDHLLFWGCGGLSLLITHLRVHQGSLWNRLKWSEYLRYSAPLFLGYLPYFVWRVSAYGEWFPNTYYAKSGSLSYWSQGGVYLSSFLLGAGAWCVVFCLCIMGIRWLWKTLIKRQAQLSLEAFELRQSVHPSDNEMFVHREKLEWLRSQLFVFCGLSAIIFGTYVTKVGGDFMLYRFFVVLVPLLWLMLLLALPRTWAGKVALVLSVAFTLTPAHFIPFKKKKWKLAAEETFYQVEQFAPLKLSSRYAKVGYDLQRLQEVADSALNVAVDCVGMIGFYTDVRVFDLFGLTSPRVAHKKLRRRGRPGHEKFGTLEDAFAEGSTMSTVDLWKRARLKEVARFARFRINQTTFFLLEYDPVVIKALKELKSKKERVTSPFHPRSAARHVKRLVKSEPQKRLAQSLRQFYQSELPKYPTLAKEIDRLETGVKVEPKSKTQLKTKPSKRMLRVKPELGVKPRPQLKLPSTFRLGGTGKQRSRSKKAEKK